MPRFRKNIHVGEDEMEFLFTQLNYPDGIGYFVTVADKNKNLYSLDIKRSAANEWKIVNKEKLPAWLVDLEPELAHAIVEARINNYMHASKDLVTY